MKKFNVLLVFGCLMSSGLVIASVGEQAAAVSCVVLYLTQQTGSSKTPYDSTKSTIPGTPGAAENRHTFYKNPYSQGHSHLPDLTERTPLVVNTNSPKPSMCCDCPNRSCQAISRGCDAISNECSPVNCRAKCPATFCLVSSLFPCLR